MFPAITSPRARTWSKYLVTGSALFCCSFRAGGAWRWGLRWSCPRDTLLLYSDILRSGGGEGCPLLAAAVEVSQPHATERMMGCPVRWGSASLLPGLVVAKGFQQARSPPAAFGRGTEGCFGTGSEQPHVGCLLSSQWYQAPLLQSYSVVSCILAPWLSPLAGLGEVLPILAPGSEGWRS